MKKPFMKLIFCCFITCVMSQEPNYTLSPIIYMTPESTKQRARKRAHTLMALKGIPDGDAALVCTNWVCPTSIVVNAVRYDVVTNMWEGTIEFDIMTTNLPPEKIARGEIETKANGLEARLSAFADESLTSMALQIYAGGLMALPVDPATNMMFMTSIDEDPQEWRRLIYKNLYVCYNVTSIATSSAATNALAFTAAIINEGLPEAERIVLPPAP